MPPVYCGSICPASLGKNLGEDTIEAAEEYPGTGVGKSTISSHPPVTHLTSSAHSAVTINIAESPTLY